MVQKGNMSIVDAGKTAVVTALDVSAGMLISGVVEMFAPPLGNQNTLQMFGEALLQLSAITLFSVEASKMLMRSRMDPTRGLPYQWGVFIGMPNTMAKLQTVGTRVRASARSAFFSNMDETTPVTDQ